MRPDQGDDQYEYHAVAGGTTGRGPSTANSQPLGRPLYSRPDDTEPSTFDGADYGTTAKATAAVEDLTADSPEPERGGATSTAKPFADFANPGRHLGSSSGADSSGGQSLGEWLLPVPSPKPVPKRGNNNNSTSSNRRRQRPLQRATANSDEFPCRKRTWGAVAPGQDNSRAGGGHGRTLGGGGSLSAWLEPLPSAISRSNHRTEPKSGRALEEVVAAAGYAQSSRPSVDEYHDDDSGNDDGGDGGNGKWMSDRLEGLDPSGAARYASGCACVEHPSPPTPTWL